MSVGETILLLAAAWLVIVTAVQVVLAPLLARGAPRERAVIGFIWRLIRLYARLVHRLRIEGREHLPAADAHHDGLLIVANHTGAADPLLVQSACRFLIRWMMAREMMSPDIRWLLDLNPPIPVDRTGRDRTALREAVRSIRAGEAVGIFPEGRIVQPTGEIRPFYEGVGLIAGKTGVPVILAWISGTPQTNDMVRGLFTPSRARIVFSKPMRFDAGDHPRDITAAIRERLAQLSGWTLNDEPMPPIEDQHDK